MLFLYRTALFLYKSGIHLLFITGNSKARLWIEGRKKQEKVLTEHIKRERTFWFHCSSLGEFEQGRPLIEKIKKMIPESFIVITFFSPSGYEVRKNFNKADLVLYLPLDSPGNARKFIQHIHPEKAFFIKYEFWYYYLRELFRKNIPVYNVSGIFRPSQPFFRWYGSLFRKTLSYFTRFFLQNKRSGELLDGIGFHNYEISGDTRFDRVIEMASKETVPEQVQDFIAGRQILVAGSTWEVDEDMILEAFCQLQSELNMALIIAPHETSPERIHGLLEKISRKIPAHTSVLFSRPTVIPSGKPVIMILDTVGHLGNVYRSGHYAYVGGGFGKGIHNVLEPAVYGIPVMFGPEHKKFSEALELIENKGGFVVHSAAEATQLIRSWAANDDRYKSACMNCANYVRNRAGTTSAIYHSVFERNPISSGNTSGTA